MLYLIEKHSSDLGKRNESLSKRSYTLYSTTYS